MQSILKNVSTIPGNVSFVSSEQLSHSSPLKSFNPVDLQINFRFDILLPEVMDALEYGVLVVRPDCSLLYANSKAQELCRSLNHVDQSPFSQLLKEICDRWYRRDFSTQKSLVIEYTGQEHRTIRARVQSLFQARSNCCTDLETAPLLVLLEDCYERFQAEFLIECQKYNLSKREAEVWNLLRQGYSYEAAGKSLHVSINTIKTHVKHIHNKQQHFQTQSGIWLSY